MPHIIAIANQKGGTGKTTTAINITAGLARRKGGRRILLIDIDPQANTTAVFLGTSYVAGPASSPTTYDLLMGKAEASKVVYQVELPANNSQNISSASFDLLPSHVSLATAEQELVTAPQRESLLKKAIAPILENYDYIIIDCPPSLGLLTINVLMVASNVLIPVEPGLFPLIGLGLLRQTIETVATKNPSLHITGILPVRVNRTNLSTSTIEELTSAFGDLILPPIPERTAIGEAHAQGMDIFCYANKSDGAVAYTTLIEELIKDE